DSQWGKASYNLRMVTNKRRDAKLTEPTEIDAEFKSLIPPTPGRTSRTGVKYPTRRLSRPACSMAWSPARRAQPLLNLHRVRYSVSGTRHRTRKSRCRENLDFEKPDREAKSRAVSESTSGVGARICSCRTGPGEFENFNRGSETPAFVNLDKGCYPHPQRSRQSERNLRRYAVQ